MKKYFTILGIAILGVVSCSSPEVEQTVDTKRSSLTILKKNKLDLDQEIKKLEAEIEKMDPSPKAKKLVTTKPLVFEDFNRYIDIQGSVLSSDAVMATSEIGGRLTSMPIDEGD